MRHHFLGDIMADDCRPIGFFDSGVGGISVLKTAFGLMPDENYIYYGDSANAPYGERTEEDIKTLSLEAGSFLFSKGVKAIVMACNTATSAAVKMIRAKYNIPVISMEPAVKPALAASKSGKVLVLATPATVTQSRYLMLLKRLGAVGRVINIGCSGLVELVENGRTDEQSIHVYLDKKLRSIEGESVTSAVIGCTHYSFVENQIKSYLQYKFDPNVSMYDGRHGTVRQLRRVLQEKDMLCKSGGGITFFTSGQASTIATYRELFKRFNG